MMKKVSRSDFLSIVSPKLRKEPGDARDSSNGSQTRKTTDNLKGTGINPYAGVWGREQILHLIRRTLFGVTQEDMAYFSKLTLNECLDVLLKPSPLPSPPVNTYNDSKKTDPDVPFGETWVDCPKHCPVDLDAIRIHSLTAWWTGLMIHQERSLTEKMTLFWHNHLAAVFNCINDSRNSYTYLAPLRAHSLGNFKTLAYEITISPGMLQYLGGYLSKAEAPNENFSRELQELFTVGKGPGSHYTQEDVVAAARLLTGWTVDEVGTKTIFKPEWHDTNDKHFSAFYNNTIIKGRSGQAGSIETKELIDMIFDQKEVARFTCRCLYRWFVNAPVSSAAEANVIEPLADIFIENKFEITPVLRAMLSSEHFYDTANMGSQEKNPVDFLIGLCRQFKITSFPSDIRKQYHAWDSISSELDKLAMHPGYPPNVGGWPAYYQSPGYYKLWLNSDTIVKRYSITDDLLSSKGICGGEDNLILQLDVLAFTEQLSAPADVDHLIAESTALLSPMPFDQTEIDFLKTLLLSWPEYDHTWTASIRTTVSSWVSTAHSWHDAWTAYTASPKDPVAKSRVTGRLRLYYTYLLQQAECHLM